MSDEKQTMANSWYWVSPDEENHIESMVDSLPIIISALDMKKIIGEGTTALKAQEEAEKKIEAVRRYLNVDMCPQLKEQYDESLEEVNGDASKLHGFDDSIREKDCCWWCAQKDILNILEG